MINGEYAPSGTAEADRIQADFDSDLELRSSGHGWMGTFGMILQKAISDLTDGGPLDILLEADHPAGGRAIYTGSAIADHAPDTNVITFDNDLTIDINDIVLFRA